MSRTFALIPAAGHSVRMGEPKLLLPIAGQPLLAHTLQGWLNSKVDHVVAVARLGDDALASFIQHTRDSQPRIELVIPSTPPPDMKASLQAALRHIEDHHCPASIDAFLVAPADMPRLSPAVIDQLIREHIERPAQILVPTLAGKRGHPVLFRWALAAEVYALAQNEGLDTLVHRHQPLLISCDHLVDQHADPFADMDTPDEYRRIASEYQQESRETG